MNHINIKTKAPVICLLLITGYLISACTNHTYTNTQYSINNPNIQVMGRAWQQPDSLKLGYPGVTVSFVSDALSTSIIASSNNDKALIDVFVDDQYLKTITLASKQTAIELYAQKEHIRHKIALVNRSESWHSIANLHRVTLQSGRLHEPAPLPTRKIMVIGDSITCGAMNERANECKKSPKLTNPSKGYGMKLANLVNAQVHLVCFSGRGLTRSWDGKTDQQAPEFINYTIPTLKQAANWDHQRYQPDAIIIALGTNDFNLGIPDESVFTDTYLNFIDTLQQHYGQANMLLTTSAMLNDFSPNEPKKSTLQAYLTHIQRQAKNNNTIMVAPNSYQPGDECDPHPLASQHTTMAKELAVSLKEQMSW